MRFLPLFHNHYTSVILPLRDAAVHTSPPHHHHDLQDIQGESAECFLRASPHQQQQLHSGEILTYFPALYVYMPL